MPSSEKNNTFLLISVDLISIVHNTVKMKQQKHTLNSKQLKSTAKNDRQQDTKTVRETTVTNDYNKQEYNQQRQ